MMSDIKVVLKGELLKRVRELKNLSQKEDDYLKKVIVHELTVVDLVSIFKYGKEFESVSSKNSEKILEMVLKLDSREFLNEIGIRKGTMSILGIVFGSSSGIPALFWAIYRVIRAGVDQCTTKCGTFGVNLPTRQYCMYKCQLNVVEKGLARAKATKCSGDQQEQCDKVRTSLEAKASQLRDKVRRYQQYLDQKGKVGKEPSGD